MRTRLEPVGLLLNLLGGGGKGSAISVEALRCDELWSSEDSRPVAGPVRSMMEKVLEVMDIFGGLCRNFWLDFFANNIAFCIEHETKTCKLI